MKARRFLETSEAADTMTQLHIGEDGFLKDHRSALLSRMQLVPETDGDPIEDHLLFILGSLGKLGQNLQTATGSVLMSVCPHMAGPGHSHGTVSGNFVLWIIVKTGQRTATLLKTVQERAVDMKSY